MTPARGALPDPGEWVDLYGDLLFRYALTRVADPELARDLVQEALLAAVQARGSFSGRSAPATWLVGILKHKIIDHFRRTAREAPSDGRDPEPDLFEPDGRWRAGPQQWRTDPALVMDRHEFWRALRGCLAELPPRQAGVFVLRELEGLETGEICQVFGVTPTNAWVLLHRARLGLRQCLERAGFRAAGEESSR